jgi:hypothetical protein
MNVVQKVGAILLFSALGAGAAMADHHRHGGSHFGVVINPFWGPAYYPPAYYPPYYYRPYREPLYYWYPQVQQPQTYIEQEAPPAPVTNYWYYCPTSRTYYPYVKRCSVPWQKVIPTPPNQ